jgi:hypothetical protein
MTEQSGKGSPRLWARLAGVFYLISVLTAVTSEFFARGRMGWFTAIAIPVVCYMIVTLLMYAVFQIVRRSLALLAVAFNLVGLVLDAWRWHPRGLNAGMVFHGAYCVLIGFLMLRSRFVPRLLGALMALAGLVWLLDLSPGLAGHLAPYNTIAGLAAEGLPMLWLLVMGVSEERWREQASGSE